MAICISMSKNNGVPYLRVLNSISAVRNGKKVTTNKTVKSLGKLSKYDDGKPNFEARVKESFIAGTPIIEELIPYVKSNSSQPLICKVSPDTMNRIGEQPKLLANMLLGPIFDQLGISQVLADTKSRSKIQYDLTGITKLLTFGRIINPCSKLSTFAQNDSYFMPPAKDLKSEDGDDQLQKIYRALDVLDKKSVAIQKRMNKKIGDTMGRDKELTFYDVTNYYFETEYNDEDENGKEGLRKRGYSKEGRRQPIVQMGLFMDNNGIPISYKLFPGNKLDQTTLRPALVESINDFDLGRVVVVADKGLNSGLNMLKLKEDGNGYVFSKSVKKSTQELRDWILKNDTKDDKYTVVSKNLKYKSRVTEVEVKNSSGKVIGSLNQKQVVKWSKKFYDRDMHENASFLEYLENCIEHPDKLKDKQSKTQKFLKKVVKDKNGRVIKCKSVLEVDTKKLQKYKDMMGYYVICTSEIDKDEDWIMTKYHELSRIEDSFRVIKSDLDGRPVYVRTPEHINAHFLICFIALTMIRILQCAVNGCQVDPETGWKFGISADKLKQGLNMLTASAQCDIHFSAHETNIEVRLLLDALSVPRPPILSTYDDLTGFKNKLAKVNFMQS
jgi:transposase